MNRLFVLTESFERSWSRMGLGDDELNDLQALLLGDTSTGDVVPGLAGARKVRIPLPGRGKSGGGRVIYVDIVVKERIFLLLAYSKNDKTDIDSAQKKVIRDLVETIKEE